jgi:hypothetical protein
MIVNFVKTMTNSKKQQTMNCQKQSQNEPNQTQFSSRRSLLAKTDLPATPFGGLFGGLVRRRFSEGTPSSSPQKLDFLSIFHLAFGVFYIKFSKRQGQWSLWPCHAICR